jgi:hypothetical protein
VEEPEQRGAPFLLELIDESERGPKGRRAGGQSAPTLAGEPDADAATVESPRLDELTSLQVSDETMSGLTRDEHPPADRARMELPLVMQELHHLELRERDAVLEQRLLELPSEQAVDASLGVDETSAGR